MVKITVLNDNRCYNDKLESEHGLSLYIECDNKKILFDSGQTDIFLKNANKLNINLKEIDYIILSHGDYDHGNGLKYLDLKVPLICHPDFLKNRISKRTGKYDGLNQNKDDFINKYNLIETKEPYYLTDNIVFLGEIPRENDFEKDKNLPMTDEEGNTYNHLDDSGLVLKTNQGLIIISGCSHSGICNIIEYAKKITDINKIDAVIGGFHLKNVDEQTNKTIKYIEENNISNVLLAHCTSDEVCEEFLNKLKDITHIVETGKTYTFGGKRVEDKKVFKLTDSKGECLEFEVLITFYWQKTKKNYIVYTDNSKDEEDNLNIFASIYYPDDDSRLDAIETSEEWDEIEKRLDSRIEVSEEN